MNQIQQKCAQNFPVICRTDRVISFKMTSLHRCLRVMIRDRLPARNNVIHQNCFFYQELFMTIQNQSSFFLPDLQESFPSDVQFVKHSGSRMKSGTCSQNNYHLYLYLVRHSYLIIYHLPLNTPCGTKTTERPDTTCSIFSPVTWRIEVLSQRSTTFSRASDYHSCLSSLWPT